MNNVRTSADVRRHLVSAHDVLAPDVDVAVVGIPPQRLDF